MKTIIPFVIKKGTKLYRFIANEPKNIKSGMYLNKGKPGRFNKKQNVYYCCKSLIGVLQEYNFEFIQGSLIVSEVKEDIVCGMPVESKLVAFLRGRTKQEKASLVHKMVFRNLGLDCIIKYNQTSKMFDKITELYQDGIVYPSVNSIDCIVNGIIYHIGDELCFSNIALTERGYSKIEEKPPIVYWHKKGD